MFLEQEPERSFQGDRVVIPRPRRHQVMLSRYNSKPPVETAEQGTHEAKSQ